MAAQLELALDNLEAVLAGADMSLANVVRLNVYTTDVDELFKHWARIAGRFGNSDSGWATSVLGVTRLAAPQLLVLLEATAVDRPGHSPASLRRASAPCGSVLVGLNVGALSRDRPPCAEVIGAER